jgi:hypothetical protein
MADAVHTDGRSVTSLVSGIVNDAQDLIKQQAALIRAEIREELQKTIQAALLLAAGAVVALPAVFVLCFAVVYLLHWAVPAVDLWVWFLIVGAVIAALCAALVLAGVKKLKSFHPIPDRSIANLRENLRWPTNPTCPNPK